MAEETGDVECGTASEDDASSGDAGEWQFPALRISSLITTGYGPSFLELPVIS